MKETVRSCAIALLLWVGVATVSGEEPTSFTWERLPDLPHAVAGPFAGVARDPKNQSSLLIVAGGMTSSGLDAGEAVWHDDVFVLEPKCGAQFRDR